jgi:hypothetical protein
MMEINITGRIFVVLREGMFFLREMEIYLI